MFCKNWERVGRSTVDKFGDTVMAAAMQCKVMGGESIKMRLFWSHEVGRWRSGPLVE